MSALRLHNTMSGQLETFTPIEPGHVRMYTCGPTVHDYAHIGNFRTFLFEDLLRRVLLQQGYRVTQVMNLTDVEDRIIKKAADRGETIDEFTEPYIEAFFQDLDTLRIQRAEHYPRATHHIFEMVSMIDLLAEKGYTYVSEGSHYFRIANFPRYGALAHLDHAGLKAGARVDVDDYGKDDPRDFVLWKARKPGEQSWETPLGAGRPGWHIECSAMSMKYLGESFDIHTGGVDNIFPHHENEIAQSEAATEKSFVRLWLHAQFLQDSVGEKMSKRLKNFTTLRDLLGERYQPRAIRYALMTGAQYRNPLAFSSELLKAAALVLIGGTLLAIDADGSERRYRIDPVSDTGFHLGVGLYGGLDGHVHRDSDRHLNPDPEYQHAVGNRKRVEREQRQRRRAINQDEVVI